MSEQLPGVRGERFGVDATVDHDEAYDLRRRARPAGNGWIISTAGESAFAHADVTGVSATASQLSFFYVPPRSRTVTLTQARISVAAAVAGATFRAALFIFDSTPSRRLVRVPGSETVFSAEATGLVSVDLPRQIEIASDAHLFIARWASSNLIVVEGFQSGAGVSPRIFRQRTISSVTPPFEAEYKFASIPVATSNADTPFIAFLSAEAAQVF